MKNEKEEDGTKDLWAQLQKIGVEDDSLGVVYWYLFNNPTALKGFNGVPIHQRKNMLPIIVPNYQPKGSDRNVKVNISFFFSSSYLQLHVWSVFIVLIWSCLCR